MSFNLTTSGACIAKAGLNYNPAVSGAILAKFCDDSEATLCAITRRDWVALSGATKTNFAGCLSNAVSSDVGNMIINSDMSGFTSRMEAQTMLDLNRDIYMRCLDVLKDDKNKEVMIA